MYKDSGRGRSLRRRHLERTYITGTVVSGFSSLVGGWTIRVGNSVDGYCSRQQAMSLFRTLGAFSATWSRRCRVNNMCLRIAVTIEAQYHLKRDHVL